MVSGRRAIEQVFVARHGQTEWNLVGRRQGQLDSPLTRTGLLSATRLAQLLTAQEVDAVFSSPLGRAFTTATIFGDALGLEVLVIDELREVDHGAMAGLTNEEIEARYPGELERRSEDRYEWCFPDGESYASADQRAATALGRISGTTAHSPLIVTHEMIGRMLIRNLLDLTVAEALGLTHPHDLLYRIDPARKQRTELRAPEDGG